MPVRQCHLCPPIRNNTLPKLITLTTPISQSELSLALTTGVIPNRTRQSLAANAIGSPVTNASLLTIVTGSNASFTTGNSNRYSNGTEYISSASISASDTIAERSVQAWLLPVIGSMAVLDWGWVRGPMRCQSFCMWSRVFCWQKSMKLGFALRVWILVVMAIINMWRTGVGVSI